MAGTVQIQRNNRCLTLVLDNVAKRNSLDLPMLRDLTDAAAQAASDPGIAVVVLRGAGNKAFCAGADFDAMTAPPLTDSVAQMDKALDAAIAALHALPMPLVAAIDGACFGGGVQIALAADIRIATSTSRFGIPAVQIGLAYPFEAIAKIARLAGSGAANLLLLSGESFDAECALRRRLVDEVIAPDELDPRLDKLTGLIATAPAASATAYKQMIRLIALSDETGARQAHDALAAQALYMPKLEEILAQRLAKQPKG